jgi:hypothetical protein
MVIFRDTRYKISNFMAFRNSAKVSKTLITALKQRKKTKCVPFDSLLRPWICRKLNAKKLHHAFPADLTKL